MSVTHLTYGGGTLALSKSDTLVGIRPTRGAPRGRGAENAAAPGLAPAGTLGGFQLLDVADGAAMELTLDTLRASGTVERGTHVWHTSDDGVPWVPTGELFVVCGAGQEAACEAEIRAAGLEFVGARGPGAYVVRVTPAAANPVKTAARLQATGLFTVAEPELATPVRPAALPSDELLAEQWHLRNTGHHRGTSQGFVAGADARVVAAWEAAGTTGSPDVVVAVIDDGFDLTHPDLGGVEKVVAPYDFTRNGTDPSPDVGDAHGTACAGVAVGTAQGSGILGAAPGCRLMPVRWGPDLRDSQVEAWFDHARTAGAAVVSCSWKAAARVFRLSERASRAIRRCATEGRGGLGAVVCFAAGNDAEDLEAPNGQSVNGFAIHPDVIAVAASTSRDERSSYSNFGAAAWICAPSSGAGGWGITTSDVRGEVMVDGRRMHAGYDEGDFTHSFGGTSSACPLVAGVAALVLSVRPTLTAAEVRQLLARTARRIGSAAGYDARGHSHHHGYGCVDAAAAVGALQTVTRVRPLWGEKGHKTTNALAVSALDGDLRTFMEAHAHALELHAMDADYAKRQDPEEGRRHYIDLDAYGVPPFSNLPEDEKKARARYGDATIDRNGVLPWAIGARYRGLVEAFRMGETTDVLRHAAWLGHYVGDAHVPLHTTRNHDGGETDQKGLHAYFETRLLRDHVSADDVTPAPAERVTSPVVAAAFTWLRESYGHVRAIVEADAATGGRGRPKRRDLDAFATVAAPIAVERLATGCTRLASLWLTAWDEAGRPDLSAFPPPMEPSSVMAGIPREVVAPPARRAAYRAVSTGPA